MKSSKPPLPPLVIVRRLQEHFQQPQLLNVVDVEDLRQSVTNLKMWRLQIEAKYGVKAKVYDDSK